MSSSRPRDQPLAGVLDAGVLVQVQSELDGVLPLPSLGGPEADLIHAMLSGVHLRDHRENKPVVGLLPHTCVPHSQGKARGSGDGKLELQDVQ